LIERLRHLYADGDPITEEAADMIEQLQKRIEELERTNSSYKNLTEAQEKQLSVLRQRIYELRGADKTLDSERAANEELTEQLAASQAREAKLREAMEKLVRFNSSNEYTEVLSAYIANGRKALSQPTDDTAPCPS